MLLLLYSSQLPPLGPACTSTIQVPDILSHWVGLGGGGRHSWGNTEVPFSMNGSCTDLTHPSFLKVLRTSSFYLLISFYTQHSLFLISSFVHSLAFATCHMPQQTTWAYTEPCILSGHSHSITEPIFVIRPMVSARHTSFVTDRQLEEGSQFSVGSCCAVA